jgi:hypothetical protein
MGTIARDAFGRTVTDGWGTAEMGGAWGIAGTAADYDITPGVATVTNATSGSKRPWITVANRSAVIRVRWAISMLPAGVAADLAVGLRADGVIGNNSYQGYTRITSGGLIRAYGYKVVAGTPTVLEGAVLDVAGIGTYVPGDQLVNEFEVVGTRLRLWVYRHGSPRPAMPTRTWTDTSLASGTTAMVMGNAADTTMVYRFYSVEVRALPRLIDPRRAGVVRPSSRT